MRTYRPKPTTKYHRKVEESDQMWLVRYVKAQYPDVIIESDFASGLNLTATQRMRMSKLRSRKKMPDIRIYKASRGYHGLVLELKKEGTAIYKKDGVTLRKQPYKYTKTYGGKTYHYEGDHLAEQAETLQAFNNAGYLARFAVGRDKMQEIVDWYMDRQQTMF